MPAFTSTSSATIRASTAQQLQTALATVRGGETILLSPGDYGDVLIKYRNLAGTVTLKSADPTDPANFGDLRIDQSSGFRFDTIDIHRALAKGEADWTPLSYISNSSRIAFAGVHFFGSLDNNSWNDGYGLRVGASKDISVTNSTFEQLHIGAIYDHVSGIVLTGNNVTDVREGFDFAAVHDATIAQNRFSHITPNLAAYDHSDAIQFWNAGVEEGSSRVVIRDNVILAGTNGGTAGIFVRAEDPTPAWRHSDFTILNNMYTGEARNGITLDGVDRATVSGNTLTTSAGALYDPALILTNTTKVIADHNILPLLLQQGDRETVLTDNIDVWDMAERKGVSVESLFGTPPGVLGFDISSGGAAKAAVPGGIVITAKPAIEAPAPSAVSPTVAAAPHDATIVTIKPLAAAVDLAPVVNKPVPVAVPEAVPVAGKTAVAAVTDVPVAIKAVAVVPEMVPIVIKPVAIVPEPVHVAPKVSTAVAAPEPLLHIFENVGTFAMEMSHGIVHASLGAALSHIA